MKRNKVKAVKAYAVIHPNWEKFGWKDPYFKNALAIRGTAVPVFSYVVCKNKRAARVYADGYPVVPVLISPLPQRKPKKH